MAKIAISYRRSDSQDITGRIFDRLVAHYGKNTVFRDIDSIRPGIDFRTQIADALQATDVLLVIVGPQWLGRSESATSRMDNEADPVRIEVETALKRDIPIIPVLVHGVKMPEVGELPVSLRDFAFRHAVAVDGGRDFDHHIEGLIRSLDQFFGGQGPPPENTLLPRARKPSPLQKYGLVGALAAVVVVLGAVLFRTDTKQPAVAPQPALSQQIATAQPPVSPPNQPAAVAQPVAPAPSQPAAVAPPPVPQQQRSADIPVAATPAFDCSKSHAPDELAICRNGQLSYLDQQLNVVFVALHSRLNKDQQATLWAQEQVWLKQRAACVGDADCIRTAYLSRISQLQSWH